MTVEVLDECTRAVHTPRCSQKGQSIMVNSTADIKPGRALHCGPKFILLIPERGAFAQLILNLAGAGPLQCCGEEGLLPFH